MGASHSRDPRKMAIGKTPAEAQAIIARRIIKCRQAIAEGKTPRIREKALALAHTCASWDGAESGVPPAVLLDAGLRAFYALETYPAEVDYSACETSEDVDQQAEDAAAWEAGEVLQLLPRLVSLAQRVHGVRSVAAAEMLHTLASREAHAGSHLKAIPWAQQASAILLELKGERYFVPDCERKSVYFSDFDTAPLLQLSEEGHLDCLQLLAECHSHVLGQAQLAHAAAGRHLSILEAIYGRMHKHTVPGLYSMMWACYLNGEGDAAAALACA